MCVGGGVEGLRVKGEGKLLRHFITMHTVSVSTSTGLYSD